MTETKDKMYKKVSTSCKSLIFANHQFNQSSIKHADLGMLWREYIKLWTNTNISDYDSTSSVLQLGSFIYQEREKALTTSVFSEKIGTKLTENQEILGPPAPPVKRAYRVSPSRTCDPLLISLYLTRLIHRLRRGSCERVSKSLWVTMLLVVLMMWT